MVCAPVRSIIPSLKLGDYLSVQAHKPCSFSHLYDVQILICLCCLMLQYAIALFAMVVL